MSELREKVARAIIDEMIAQMRPAPGPENHAWWTGGGMIDKGKIADAAILVCREHFAGVVERHPIEVIRFGEFPVSPLDMGQHITHQHNDLSSFQKILAQSIRTGK